MPDIWWYDSRKQWCADVPDMEDPDRRKRLYLGADKKEANQKLHRYLARFYAREPERQGDESDSLSLYALTARFLTWTETNLSESTQEMYEHQLKTFVEKHGHRDAKEITPSDVENRKADIKRAGKKPRTINFFVQSIKRLYNWGVEQGLLDENPIEKVSRIPKDPPKDRSLDDEEVEVFLEYARESPPLGDFCEFLLLTGMRVGELRGMRWDDIDRKLLVGTLDEHSSGTVQLDIAASERELLDTVASFATDQLDGDRHYLTAFNGETWNGGFDLPFCRTRFLQHDMSWPFGDLAYADMMQIVDRFDTKGHSDLVGVYDSLLTDETCDPFDDSEEAVGAFEDAEWLPLLKHNLADIQRTRELARLAGRFVPKSDFSMKNLQPPDH